MKKKVKKVGITMVDLDQMLDKKLSVMAGNVQQVQQPGAAYLVPAQQQQQQQYHPSKKPVKGQCFLCGKNGHAYADCFTYKNMTPGSVTCQTCGGRHPVPCRTRMNYKQSEPSNRQSNTTGQPKPPPYSANNSSGQQFQMGSRLGNGGRQAHPAN